MAPATGYRPLDFPLFARAYDAELGSPERGDQPSETNSHGVSFSDRPILKDFTPRFKNLTPWAYVAVVIIALIILFVLGYALSNCYRKMKHRHGTTKPRYQNLSLLKQKSTTGKPSSPGGKRKFAWAGTPKALQGIRVDEGSPNFSNKNLPLSRSGSKNTGSGLEYTIALPSSCYIPYTPTSHSLARSSDEAVFSGSRTLRKQPGKDNRRSKTKSILEAFKRKTGLEAARY